MAKRSHPVNVCDTYRFDALCCLDVALSGCLALGAARESASVCRNFRCTAWL